MADRDQPFLRRWSRRKRQGGAAPVVKTESADLPPVEMAKAKPEDALPATTDDATTDDATTDDATADLPEVETLDKDSDYTGFLREGVPEQLRRRALRKLWLSDPAFAFRDGLNDYDEDFALAFTDAVTKTVKTAYKVGKGFVDDDDEKEAEEAETKVDVPVADDDREGGSKSADGETVKADGANEADEEKST